MVLVLTDLGERVLGNKRPSLRKDAPVLPAQLTAKQWNHKKKRRRLQAAARKRNRQHRHRRRKRK